MNEMITMHKIPFKLKPALMVILTLFGVIGGISDTTAQKTSSVTYVKIGIDGLSCPFCAYGLEKGLKKIDDVGDVFISVEKAYTTFFVPTKNQPSEEELKKIVEDAGFEVRKIEFSKLPFPKEDD